MMVLCLLFQQIALASYVCSPLENAPGARSMAAHCAAMAQHAVAGAALAGKSDGPTAAPSALCDKHCAPDQTTAAGQVAFSAPAMLLPSAFAIVRGDVAQTGQRSNHDDCIVRSDPPPRLRYCSLLI